MNIKTALALALGSVILTLAGTVLFVGLTLGDAPVASAEQLMQDTCRRMERLDNYDITGTITADKDGVIWEEVISVEARLSGDDYQVKYTASTDGATAEFIRVGGVGYWRESMSGNVWKRAAGPLGDLDIYIRELGDTPACPGSLTSVARDGEETLRGASTTLFTSGEGATALARVPSTFRGIKEVQSHTYWVDQGGQLVQHRHDRRELHATDAERFTVRTMTTKTFTGVGETNTITAPVVGSP